MLLAPHVTLVAAGVTAKSDCWNTAASYRHVNPLVLQAIAQNKFRNRMSRQRNLQMQDFSYPACGAWEPIRVRPMTLRDQPGPFVGAARAIRLEDPTPAAASLQRRLP